MSRTVWTTEPPCQQEITFSSYISIYLDLRYVEIYSVSMKHGPLDASDDHHGRPHRGRGGKRMFDYGELRLLILAMILQRPFHGYELMKAIEQRLGGNYTPSPGVIYPTLAWLDDMGYASIELEEGGRKLYHVTEQGRAFIDANRSLVEELLTRAVPGERGHDEVPDAIIRAMENLKLALRLRLRKGPPDEATTGDIANILDEAARAIERRS